MSFFIRIRRTMSLTRKELHRLVQDDVMIEPSLQNIEESIRRRCIQMVLGSTNPNHTEPVVELAKLVAGLAELRYREPSKENKNEISNKILTALKCSIVNLQEGVDYFGEVRESKGKWKAYGQVRIKWEKINMILLSQYFAGDFAIEIYRRCYERTFASYRKHVEAGRGHEQEKRLYLNQSAICRRALSRDVATAGVNAKFGIMTYLDKMLLKELVPGKGNQRQKIARARDIETFKGSSCVAELNPGTQAYRTFMLDRLKHRMANDEEFTGSNDASVKRRRLSESMKVAIDETIAIARYSGVTEEENAKLVYSPATDVHRRLSS